MLFAVSAVQADTLFEKPFDPTTAATIAVPSEATDGGFYNIRVADAFNLATGSTVETLVWWGSEEGFFSVNFPGNVAGFNLQLHTTDGSELPLSNVLNTSIPVGDVTATNTGFTTFTGATIFEFSYDLPSGLALPAGAYTFSPAATFVVPTTNEDSFFLAAVATLGLAEATPPSGSYTFDQTANEFSYRIEGVVPEPTSAMLLAAGAGLFLRRRRA